MGNVMPECSPSPQGFHVADGQMVWRPDPNLPGGLTLFGVALFNTSGRVKEDHSVELGLLQLGTFAGRDHDTVGLVVSDQHFSGLFADNILAARTTSHDDAAISRHEIMLELNYGLQVTPAFRLTPNLQYIVNPDQAPEPTDRHIRNAFVIGAKAAIASVTFAAFVFAYRLVPETKGLSLEAIEALWIQRAGSPAPRRAS